METSEGRALRKASAAWSLADALAGDVGGKQMPLAFPPAPAPGPQPSLAAPPTTTRKLTVRPSNESQHSQQSQPSDTARTECSLERELGRMMMENEYTAQDSQDAEQSRVARARVEKENVTEGGEAEAEKSKGKEHEPHEPHEHENDNDNENADRDKEKEVSNTVPETLADTLAASASDLALAPTIAASLTPSPPPPGDSKDQGSDGRETPENDPTMTGPEVPDDPEAKPAAKIGSDSESPKVVEPEEPEGPSDKTSQPALAPLLSGPTLQEPEPEVVSSNMGFGFGFKKKKESTSSACSSSSQGELPRSFFVDPNRSRKVVRSLAEAFMFESDCIETIWDEDGDEAVHKLMDAMQDDTMSTAFSGIEAAGTAMQCLRRALSDLTGQDVPKQKVHHQIEWNKDCQSELVPLAKLEGTCVFPNIATFFRNELESTVEACLQKPAMAVEVLGPLISERKAMKLDAHCLTHNRVCSLRHSKRHVAGTSCKPWSKKGSGLGAADPEIVFTLAWIGLVLMLEDDEVLSENVRSQGGAGAGAGVSSSASRPVVDAGLGNLLLRFLSPMYHLETTVLDPSMIGEPFSREREFVKMRHKAKCLSTCSPISQFQKRFFRMCQWSWKSALAAFALVRFGQVWFLVFACFCY